MFHCINRFYREVPTVVSAMRNLTVGVFEHLDIKSKLGFYKIIKYTDIIMVVSELINIVHHFCSTRR